MKLTFSRFLSILSYSWHPFGRLWGHMKALFPLLFSSRFLRGVFITFTLPGGTPNGPPAGKGGTSGSVGILHFDVLEEVIMWVSAHFSICRLCAAP